MNTKRIHLRGLADGDTQLIYGLYATDEPHLIRYIGKTSSGMYARYNQHLYQCKRNNMNLYRWFREVGSRDSIVSIKLIEEISITANDITLEEYRLTQALGLNYNSNEFDYTRLSALYHKMCNRERYWIDYYENIFPLLNSDPHTKVKRRLANDMSSIMH